MSERPGDHETTLARVSVITCPECGHEQADAMPEFSCAISWHCPACAAVVRPLPGDCCVYCSYGSVPCPAIQIARRAG